MWLKVFEECADASLEEINIIERTHSKTLGNHKKMEE